MLSITFALFSELALHVSRPVKAVTIPIQLVRTPALWKPDFEKRCFSYHKYLLCARKINTACTNLLVEFTRQIRRYKTFQISLVQHNNVVDFFFK